MGALHINGQKATGVNITLSEGVFMDADNLIFSYTINSGSISQTEYSYTATEDCYVRFMTCTPSANQITKILIDNAEIFRIQNTGTDEIFSDSCLLKKGQVIKLSNIGPYTNIGVYGIQQGTIEGKLQPVIYSTEEREIGVWTDGKPVYQKSYDNLSFILPSQTNWVDTGIPVTDIDADTYITGFIIDEYKQSFPTVLATLSSTNTIGIIVAGNQSNRTITGLTLQYTKTTDQPGAGTWTPDGVYAHHYSTDEKVIGTWIDGSTLYEKTVEINNIAFDNDWHTVAHGITNIDKVISCTGIMFGTDGEFFNLPQYRANTNQGITFGIQGNSSEYIGYVNNWYSNPDKIYATIQYTKSSS